MKEPRGTNWKEVNTDSSQNYIIYVSKDYIITKYDLLAIDRNV